METKWCKMHCDMQLYKKQPVITNNVYCVSDINNLPKEQIQIESTYSSYLARQRADIEDFKREEGLVIPKKTNFKDVGSLSNEIVEKLTKTRPPTLGAASRISGVTPAAIIAIMRFLKKQKNNKAA